MHLYKASFSSHQTEHGSPTLYVLTSPSNDPRPPFYPSMLPASEFRSHDTVQPESTQMPKCPLSAKVQPVIRDLSVSTKSLQSSNHAPIYLGATYCDCGCEWSMIHQVVSVRLVKYNAKQIKTTINKPNPKKQNIQNKSIWLGAVGFSGAWLTLSHFDPIDLAFDASFTRFAIDQNTTERILCHTAVRNIQLLTRARMHALSLTLHDLTIFH